VGEVGKEREILRSYGDASSDEWGETNQVNQYHKKKKR
jgi:hypothetical protein